MKKTTKGTVLKQRDKSYPAIQITIKETQQEWFWNNKWVSNPPKSAVDKVLKTRQSETEQGIVWVDKDAEIKNYNYHTPYLVDGRIEIYDNHTDWTHLDCPPIIAANFDLEGVPKIELEDDLRLQATFEGEKIYTGWNKDENSQIALGGFVRGYKHGYKANQAKYTEEDIYKAIDYTLRYGRQSSVKWIFNEVNSIKEITVDENFKLLNIK